MQLSKDLIPLMFDSGYPTDQWLVDGVAHAISPYSHRTDRFCREVDPQTAQMVLDAYMAGVADARDHIRDILSGAMEDAFSSIS